MVGLASCLVMMWMHSCLNSSHVVLSFVREEIIVEYFPSLRVVDWIRRRSVTQRALIGSSTSLSHSVMVPNFGLNSRIDEHRSGCAMPEQMLWMHSCLNSSQVVVFFIRTAIIVEYSPSLRVADWIWRRSVSQIALIGPSTSWSQSMRVSNFGLNSGSVEQSGSAMTK